MTTFDDRQKAEESRFGHDQQLNFKIRNRRNRLFGEWIGQDHLRLTGEAVTAYAKEIVLADFDEPGDDDVLRRVRSDLEKAKVELSDHLLKKHLAEFGEIAREQLMKE